MCSLPCFAAGLFFPSICVVIFLVNLVLCDNFIAYRNRLVVAADLPYYRPLSFVYFFGLNHD